MQSVLDWGSRRFFEHIHDRNLIYNTCWEDPRLDREAMQLSSSDHVLMITSAGCNALDYALDRPAHIFAVDVNPRQNALLDLKMSGIRSLEFDTFFEIFGRGRISGFQQLYKDKLRPGLSESSREYWDRHQEYFMGSKFRPTFYFRGTSGLFASILARYIDLKKSRGFIEEMFEAKSLEDQEKIYHHYVKPMFWGELVRWFMRKDMTLSLLGVPRAQRHQIEQNYSGGVAKFIEDCVERVFTRLPLNDNYFWWLYFNGEYSPHRCPEYLTEKGFEALKGGAVERISTHNSTILDFLRFSDVSISKFVLLDHMDWLSTHSLETLACEWQSIFNRARQGAQILWRSASQEVDYVDPLRVVYKGAVRTVGDLLSYDNTTAHRLHARDRVHTYGSFYIANFA